MRDNQGNCHCGAKGMPQVRPGEHHTQCQGSTEKKPSKSSRTARVEKG